MTTFFRFPHTPHIAWLGKEQPRDDKVLAPAEAEALLRGPVTVEEKVDGANVGISIDENGDLRAQNRGAYLTRESGHLQFKPLFRWLDERRTDLESALFSDLMLFGEWCHAVHSVAYDRLPDWFLAFDIYDRAIGRFWSVPRRDELVRQLGLALIPRVAGGRFDLAGLQRLFGKSRLADAPAEGLYIRADEGDVLVARAKLVRAEFTQSIEEHWSKRAMRTNSLAARA